MGAIQSFWHSGSTCGSKRDPIEPESADFPVHWPIRRYDRKGFLVLRELRLFGLNSLQADPGLYVNGRRWLEKPVTTRN